MNSKEPKIIEHLAFLSVKHHVYLSELYQALVYAKEDKKAVCGDLTIAYRGMIKNEAIFLITKGSTVVGQFRVQKEFLLRQDISFESWLDTNKIRRQQARQYLGQDSILIENLRHGMKKVNVNAEVLEIQKPQLIHTQYGNTISLTNFQIADETGKVKFCLWGEKPNSIVVGDKIRITHASVRAFKGDRQLSIGKTGTLSILQSKTTTLAQESKMTPQNVIYA
jgi:hypothetical protein